MPRSTRAPLRLRGMLVAASLGVLALVAGCTGVPTVVEGSTVTVAVSEPTTSLNASTSYGRTGANADVAHLTGSAFAFRDDAQRIQTDPSFGSADIVSRDPFTVRYRLQSGLRWSDGAPIDAVDLLLAWVADSGARNDADFDDSRFVDRETGRYTDDFPEDVVYFDGAIGAGLERTSALPTIGDGGRSLTVEFERPVRDWQLLLRLGLPAHIVAAGALGESADSGAEITAAKQRVRDAILDDDRDDLADLSRYWNDGFTLDGQPDAALTTASGPYRVDTVADDGSITLRANDGYRGDRQPTFETIALRLVADPLEAVRLLESGEVDIVSPSPTGEVADALRAVDGVTVTTGTQGTWEHLDLQQEGSRSGVFDDEIVREAFLATMPREQILDEVVRPIDPDAALLQSFTLRPGSDGYAESIEQNGSEEYAETDRRRAASLLARAGVEDPEVCVLYDPNNPRRVDQYALIKESAERSGFVVTSCASSDWDRLLGVEGAYDAALFAWDTTRLGPAGVSAIFQSDSTRTNHTGFSDAEADEIIGDLAVELDERRQTALLSALDERVWASAYGLPLFEYPTLTAVDDRVGGVTRAPSARGVFWNAWEWKPVESGDSGSSG